MREVIFAGGLVVAVAVGLMNKKEPVTAKEALAGGSYNPTASDFRKWEKASGKIVREIQQQHQLGEIEAVTLYLSSNMRNQEVQALKFRLSAYLFEIYHAGFTTEFSRACAEHNVNVDTFTTKLEEAHAPLVKLSSDAKIIPEERAYINRYAKMLAAQQLQTDAAEFCTNLNANSDEAVTQIRFDNYYDKESDTLGRGIK